MGQRTTTHAQAERAILRGDSEGAPRIRSSSFHNIGGGRRGVPTERRHGDTQGQHRLENKTARKRRAGPTAHRLVDAGYGEVRHVQQEGGIADHLEVDVGHSGRCRRRGDGELLPAGHVHDLPADACIQLNTVAVFRDSRAADRRGKGDDTMPIGRAELARFLSVQYLLSLPCDVGATNLVGS